jgi:hypothetical protein
MQVIGVFDEDAVAPDGLLDAIPQINARLMSENADLKREIATLKEEISNQRTARYFIAEKDRDHNTTRKKWRQAVIDLCWVVGLLCLLLGWEGLGLFIPSWARWSLVPPLTIAAAAALICLRRFPTLHPQVQRACGLYKSAGNDLTPRQVMFFAAVWMWLERRHSAITFLSLKFDSAFQLTVVAGPIWTKDLEVVATHMADEYSVPLSISLRYEGEVCDYTLTRKERRHILSQYKHWRL